MLVFSVIRLIMLNRNMLMNVVSVCCVMEFFISRMVVCGVVLLLVVL